ncbi:hypothetical protein [Pelobium manganitolerans]|uniref:hypothetical protein n=1 Tax=Pelobium manganitolerans TaxID=1842495 RepID=UPI003FA3C434
MKQFISFLMMFLSLLIGFQQAIIVINFQLNQKTIERELCINKLKPQMHCYGVCQLKKRLKDAEQANSKSTETHHKVEMLQLQSRDFDLESPISQMQIRKQIHQIGFYASPHPKIFVPPPSPGSTKA